MKQAKLPALITDLENFLSKSFDAAPLKNFNPSNQSTNFLSIDQRQASHDLTLRRQEISMTNLRRIKGKKETTCSDASPNPLTLLSLTRLMHVKTKVQYQMTNFCSFDCPPHFSFRHLCKQVAMLGMV